MEQKTTNKVIDIKTKLDKEPTAYQLTLHLENLKAYYGEATVKKFLKEFYFNTKKEKKVSNG